MSASDVVASIHAAADNAAKVMPPLAAEHLRRELLAAAHAISEVRDEIAQILIQRWAERVAEINDYAARARQHVEHEVFLAGTSPEDAAYTAPCDTLDDALAADGWLSGAGAAHREVIWLYGPWQIDRPATSTTRETAA